MNKIFKVVWSKTKECYVVVSEVAKNNGGKKKVLASVLATLAIMGAGVQVQAADSNTDTSANTSKQINIWANTPNKENPATPGASTVSGSGNANANDVDPSTYGTEIGIAIGAQNKIKPGNKTNAGGGSSIAMGIQNEVRGNRNVAIGTNSKTYGENSIALGTQVEAGTGHGIAIGSIDGSTATVAYGGTTPNATGSNVGNAFALAIGSGAQADGRANNTSGGIAIGQLVKATHNNTIAIGVKTTASDSNSVAIGSSAQATQKLSTAYGPSANANSKGGVAIGTNAAVGTDTGLTTAITGATAVGAYAEAQSENGSAFGRNAKADKNAEKATALGAYATANIAGGVALGSESKTTVAAGVTGYNPAAGRTNKYDNLTNNTKAALTSTRAAVSIGDDSASVTRQLTGLAAGTQDTDAVNVAQLKAVNLKYAADTGNSDVLLKDGTLNIKGDNKFISTSADGTGITVTAKIGDSITANAAGKAVAPATNGIATTTNVTDAINNSGWNVISSNNGGSVTGTQVAALVKPGNTVTLSAGKNIVLDQNDKQFTYSLNKDVDLTNAGSLTVGGTKVNNDGITIKAPTTSGTTTTNVTLTNAGLNNGGNKITNVAEGKADTDAVNVKQLKDAKTILKDGKNTTVVGTGTPADPYKVNVEGALTGITSIANTATGPKMTFGGSSINITGGSLDMGNNKITNLATGTDDKDAVNVKQLKDTEIHITPGTYTPDSNKKVTLTYENGDNKTVAGKTAVIDLSGLATGGTASTESVVKKAAATGDTNIADVSVAGGKAVNDPGAQYEVSVSKNAVKDAAREAVTVNNGGNTDNPISVTPTPDNTNHNTTYAVTFDGNKAAKQIPLTYKANGTGDKTVKLDKGLDFTNGTNTTAEIGNDGVVKFNLNKDVDLSNTGSLTVGGTKVNNGGVTITAPAGGTTTDVKLTNTGLDNGGNKIINVKDGDVNATSKDAVNGSQLYTVDQKFNNNINLGADGNTETTKLALNNAGGIKFNIKGDGSGASGANQYISTTASGSDIKVDLTQAAKDKLNKTYNVTSTDNSVKVTTTSANGVTTFDLKVAPATGTTSTWDIKSSADTANGGATATGHETNAKTIANTNSVEMIAGKNLTVKQTSDTNGAKVEFALSDEIAVGKDGANGIDGKIGVNGKDGASVVINGKDGSIGLTGAPGTPGAPGASATLKVKDGVPGVDGAPGTNLTRIVYTDKNNVDHEVATHDDGMKFAGDDGQANQATNANVIKKHLNSVVDIIGGATKADLTTNNIGVNNDGNKLLVQLSKNLNGINTIKNGGTTITLNDAPGGATNTPALTISGGNLSMGDGTHNNKIVNVAPGTDDNDAVNYKQLKAAKTEVKAGDNVTVKLTTDTTDGHNVYTVSAVTPAVYTKADGTKVYKIVDPTSGAVTWNTNPDGTGTVVNAGDVITSFETPANGSTPGSTTGGTMIVNNVGSAINGKTGATYLDKLNAAAGDNNTKHAAVNVTDLKSTADALTDKGLKFDANVGGVKTNKLGSIVKVQGAGASADADYSGANIKTFINQTGDDTTIDVKLDKNLAGINSISNTTTGPKMEFGGNSINITGGSLNMGGSNITNLKSGIVNNNNTDDTNGANIGDVKKIAKDSDLHIAPTAGTTNNVAEYTVDANNKVTLTYQDGNGTAVAAPKAVIDLSALANKITSGYTFNANAIANGGTVANDATTPAAVTAVANGGTINYAAGKNLTVKQDIDATAKTHTYTYSLDKDLTNLDKVVVNGKDGIAGKDGVTIVGPQGATGATGIPGTNGIDGKVGIAGKDGKDAVSISGKDGVGTIGLTGPQGPAGADGKGVDITTDHGTKTLVNPEVNNGDKSERIVYVPKDKDGNPLKDANNNPIKREVATMDDGLKFTGNNTGTENKHKLGSLVKVQGEGVSAADEAAFQSATGNIAVTANGTDTLTIRLNKNLKGLNSIQLGDNTIKSNGDNIEFTTKGGTTKTVATTDQLWTIQADGTDVPAKAGKVNLVAGDHITITPDAANGKMTISATGFGSMDGFNVKSSASTGGTHAGDTTENIKNGKTVDMQAGKNLTVTQTNDGNGNTTVNYALNKDVDLGTTGSLKIGDTTINNGGLTIANGPSITSTGVDAGSKKITNVSDGAVTATSKDAVNGSQLKKYTDAAKTTVEAGDDNVKVETDNSAADGHTNYKVSLKPVVEIGDTHKVKIDGHTGDITGLTNVTLNDPTFATKGRAATEEQLKQVLTEAKNKAIEKVQAGTAAAGDTNIATVLPKAGDTFGAAGATYEVSVSKNAVKDAAKEAVKVTSVSPAITVTPDTSVAHETTYKVGFDGNQAATQIPLTYKQNGGNTRTVKLSDGLNFIDGTNTKARTAADGKVTFDVMGDLTGITSISNNATSGPKMTFGGSSINVTGGNLSMGDGTHNNKIVNVAPGTDGTDAVNLNQLNGVRTKVSPGRNVTVDEHPLAGGGIEYVVNAEPAGTVDLTNVNNRVDQLGEEVGRVGAQGAALSALKPIQYDPLEPTQIMAGYGNYRGTSAIAMGVAHYKNESTLIHGGISWAGGSSHMMANAGVTWKVGNRDSEAAVADRYRKGPISSAYAMQQEMAAMKAQNAGLKGEVSDLKAENEQMKAQIAAMMAKLGL